MSFYFSRADWVQTPAGEGCIQRRFRRDGKVFYWVLVLDGRWIEVNRDFVTEPFLDD